MFFMRTKTVIIVIFAAVLVLLLLGVGLSFLFLNVSPDISFFTGGTVAVIELNGTITNDTGLLPTATAEDLAELINRADSNPAIDAILLEINSGGGTAVATKQIVRAIRDANKPTVAWISDIGASGAYYSAAACDFVMADRDSLTGSIGSLSVLLDLSDLKEKHGIGAYTFSRGEHKAMGSPFSELDEVERKIMNEIVQESGENFKQAILRFRGEKLDKSRLSEIFDGRIMNGSQALSYGLIDGLGLKQDAVKKAGELIGVKKPTVKELTTQRSLFQYFSQMGYAFGEGFKQSLSSGEISLQS